MLPPRAIAGAGLAWATIVGPAWSAAAAAQAQAVADAIGAFADASQAWADAIGSAFVGWAMAQAQADADFGIAGAIAGATAGKAAAAAGSMFTAAASRAAGDLTRALNAVQAGFVDAATAASVKATKTIAAAETVERKAVAKADVVLAKDLQDAWGTYAATERSAVTANARERATIGADYQKDVAGAELAAVKAVAPARKTSRIATAEANGVYHVKVTGIIADLGILSGEIRVESTKAKATSITAWLGQKAQGLWDTANDVVGTISKSYDAISMAAHTTLSGLGVIPGFGIVPDLADLALTAAELPFGKSTTTDLGLATLGVVATIAPGPVDGVAAGAKIAARTAKAGVKVADAGRQFIDGAAGAGKNLTAAASGTAELGGLNLFKFTSDQSLRAKGWRDGDYFLYLPNQGTAKLNWAQNSSRLREAMRQGKPIYDSYIDEAGNMIPTPGFLNAERNLLKNRGWSFYPATGAWHPPATP